MATLGNTTAYVGYATIGEYLGVFLKVGPTVLNGTIDNISAYISNNGTNWNSSFGIYASDGSYIGETSSGKNANIYDFGWLTLTPTTTITLTSGSYYYILICNTRYTGNPVYVGYTSDVNAFGGEISWGISTTNPPNSTVDFSSEDDNYNVSAYITYTAGAPAPPPTSISPNIISYMTEPIIYISNLANINRDKIGASPSKWMGLTVPAYYWNRGVFGGGYGPAHSNIIDYVQINTLSNASDFGDLTAARYYMYASCANGSNNRGVFAGGDTGTPQVNIIDYITISIIGNAIDFGDLTLARKSMGAVSNLENNLGVFNGGVAGTTNYNVIDYICIVSIGNAIDFGDLFQTRGYGGATSNGTNNRSITFGGNTTVAVNTIDYFAMTAKGNALDFGDLLVATNSAPGISNATNDRGVFLGAVVNGMEYITITTLGNGTTFGNMSITRSNTAGFSNATGNRGIAACGYTSERVNIMDYITINSPSNAIDFGDATVARYAMGGCSNAGSLPPPSVILGDRGIFGGGNVDGGSTSNILDYITFGSLTNAVDFGDLKYARDYIGACSSSVRGTWAGAYLANIIDYITISTLGNGADFGGLSLTRGYISGCSNNNVGILAGGHSGSVSNVIDYYYFAILSSAVDFGDLLTAGKLGMATITNSTRAIFCGGKNLTTTYYNTMNYITITTKGNSVAFGGILSSTRAACAGLSNGIRGVIGGGGNGSGGVNIMEYITIATGSDAQDFGDLSYAFAWPGATACQPRDKGVWGGTSGAGDIDETMNSITISTLGAATDFGNLSVGRYTLAAVSDCHGGLV